MIATAAAILLFSVLAGFIGSLLGLGGGIIIIPALTLVMGIDIKYAIGARVMQRLKNSTLRLFFISGKSGYPGSTFPAAPLQVIKVLAVFKPYAVMLTGLMLLILTPVFRVGVSIILFLKEKGRLYVIITSIVFLILVISFLLGKGE